MMKYVIILIAIIGGLSSCNPSMMHYTSEFNNTNDWSESDLQKIQFYLSDDIVLYKDSGYEESEISNGGFNIKDESHSEKIIFTKGTPGVLLFTADSDNFAISFDNNENSDRFLMFGPSKKANGRFVLLAKKWDKHEGRITYNNEIYTTPSRSAYASLLVKINEVKRRKHHTDRVGGRRL